MKKIQFRQALSRRFIRLKNFCKWILSNCAKNSVIVWFFPGLRSHIWRVIGVKIGKNVDIGWDVFLDVNYAHLLTIEDDVWIANKSTIFCHRRDMSNYKVGDRYKNLIQGKHPVVIKKGACISIGAMIMPGVTIGTGSVVGAGSVVTKDVPDWTVVVGVPAKVIKKLED